MTRTNTVVLFACLIAVSSLLFSHTPGNTPQSSPAHAPPTPPLLALGAPVPSPAPPVLPVAPTAPQTLSLLAPTHGPPVPLFTPGSTPPTSPAVGAGGGNTTSPGGTTYSPGGTAIAGAGSGSGAGPTLGHHVVSILDYDGDSVVEPEDINSMLLPHMATPPRLGRANSTDSTHSSPGSRLHKWNEKSSPERKNLAQKVLSGELRAFRGATARGKKPPRSIKGSLWSSTLYRILGMHSSTWKGKDGTPNTKFLNKLILSAFMTGMVVHRAGHVYVALATQRKKYPWLILHGMVDEDDKVRITVGDESTTSHHAPCMLISASGEWFIVLEEGADRPEPFRLFSTHPSALAHIDPPSFLDNDQTSLHIAPDIFTSAGIRGFFDKRTSPSRIGRLLDFSTADPHVVEGRSVRPPAPPATAGAPALPPKPRRNYNFKERFIKATGTNKWDLTQLLPHLKEDKKHSSRHGDIGATASLTHDSIEAMRLFLKEDSKRVDQFVVPAIYLMDNMGQYSFQARAQLAIPVYALRVREESAERGKRQRRWQEAHGTPLGFIFCVVRGGLLAGEQVNFSTFYTTEIMRGEVSMSPLYRSEHGARFERLMNTPIEDLVGAENVPKVYQ